MKKLLLLFFLFYSIRTFAQVDYLFYHQLINNAENHIANEDFSNAQKQFNATFQQFDYVFTKDYVIATQIAWLNKDTSQTKVWMEESINEGIVGNDTLI